MGSKLLTLCSADLHIVLTKTLLEDLLDYALPSSEELVIKLTSSLLGKMFP